MQTLFHFYHTAQLLLKSPRGVARKNVVWKIMWCCCRAGVELFYSGYHCKCKCLQHRKWQKTQNKMLNVELRGRQRRLNQYQSNILSSTEVLITQGFIKSLITDWVLREKISRFIASVSEHINSITASHQSCVYRGKPSARQRQVSSWPARTHTIISRPSRSLSSILRRADSQQG